MSLTYHNGDLLENELKISILWYGKTLPAQKSIIVDFLGSLNSPNKIVSRKTPTVSKWWQTIQAYLTKAGKRETRLVLSDQFNDEKCSIGKTLKKSQISELADSKKGELTIVLTAEDVAVEGFCMSNCGYHGSGQNKRSVFIWVGNSVTQCLGQCAWPFHQPIYGPQTKPLGAPNGDVGVDGMVVNIASLLAGVVTNPYGNGYYQGPAEAPLEAASACAGLYGKGAYPGYVGELLVDSITGASYKAHDYPSVVCSDQSRVEDAIFLTLRSVQTLSEPKVVERIKIKLFGTTTITRKIILEGGLVVVDDGSGSGSGAAVGANDAPLTVFEITNHYDYDHTVEAIAKEHNITIDNPSITSREEEKVEPVSSEERKNYPFEGFNISDKAPKKLIKLINDYSEWIANGLLKHHADRNCGLFVAAYTEYLSDGLQVPKDGLDVGLLRKIYAAPLWKYGEAKSQKSYARDFKDPR
ncbi:Protein EXORDIUM [Capsicum baccatum]|uniref:Protein EXORDIUM n=1 Tax=Capsicum baccatum TaxID=33114 RepID=A0A2G2WZV1_CAPBA|nr:Protein EXORDIUM [Capsicum baccatum]